MPQLTIFIPGIMGSSLRQPGGGARLWHEDAWASLSQLVGGPQLLQCTTPHVALDADGVLEEIKFLKWKRSLCKRLREEMGKMEEAGKFSYVEFPYDWRRDIFDAAKEFGDWLAAAHGFGRGADGKQLRHADKRLNIITHSMGSLVAALALMEGHVHPGNVRRLVSVGAPFMGAPASFRALYSTGHLPFMEWVNMWIGKGLNRKERRKAILAAVQSFLSSFQLLPHAGHPFVLIRGGAWMHPFADKIIDDTTQQLVQRTHKLLLDYENFLLKEGVAYHFIYGSAPQNLFGLWTNNTPHQFKASYDAAGSGVGSTYTDVKIKDRTRGDGTVPLLSATLNKPNDRGTRTGVPGVGHAYMCNHGTVVDKIKQLLS